MSYKIYQKENELFIKYFPLKKNISKKQDKKDYSNNPFNVLNQLNLKQCLIYFQKKKKQKKMKVTYL